jgi:hypothetical protein
VLYPDGCRESAKKYWAVKTQEGTGLTWQVEINTIFKYRPQFKKLTAPYKAFYFSALLILTQSISGFFLDTDILISYTEFA